METKLELHNYWDNFLERAENSIKGNFNLDRLTVHVTSLCNLSCKYCNMKRTHSSLDKEIVMKIVEEYANMGGKLIHFTGGEPTILNYMEEVISESHKRGLEISLNTNAVDRINYLDKINKLKCSFDHCNNLDSFYGVNGVTRKINENIKYYSENVGENNIVSITCVVTQNNYLELPVIVEYVRQNFPKVYNIYFSAYKGHNYSLALTDRQCEYLINIIFPVLRRIFDKYKDGYSLKQLSIYEPRDFKPDRYKFSEHLNTPCYLQQSELTIGVDYKIYNCSHLYRDEENHVHNLDIRTHSLRECYLQAKKSVVGDIPLSCNCLSGCNRNLCNFNKFVAQALTSKL